MDDNFMKEALACAQVCAERGDAAFGAVIVDNETNEIVAKGYNHASKNPLWHGETDAINNLAEVCAAKDRSVYESSSSLTLYTTAEPCPMCAAAIIWSGIPRVVYGTSIDSLIKFGWSQMTVPCRELAERSWIKQDITGGVLEAECDQLYNKGPPWMFAANDSDTNT